MVGRLLSHYAIQEQIGAGGMGIVYRAHDEHLDRDVAIKVLPPHVLSDEAARKRFRKEALALARLNHPNVEIVHEFGSEDGVDFLVTEYIPGLTLDVKLARGPLTEEEVLRMGVQFAGVGDRLGPAQIATTIKNGKGRMSGFPNLDDDQMFALVTFLLSGENKELSSSVPAPSMKYRFTGYHRFYDPEGYPAVVPPWGTLNAIDLNTGEYVWKIPLGEYPELAAKGLKNTGTENYGGPIVTAGGLVFIGATNFDKKFRAFDKATGELLWETTLPFAANTTAATYEVNGRQFVVIAAGGGKDPKSPSGGVYVAFALPQ